MPLPFPIAASQTDAKSPIDQQLMDAIRLDLDYLDAQVSSSSGGGQVDFRINGRLKAAKLRTIKAKKLDGAIITQDTSYTTAKLYQKLGGTSGTTSVDVLRNTKVDHPIIAIDALYEAATQSIGRLGSPLSTQSIALATPTINTQLIEYAKAANSIRAILPYGTDKWLITFTGAVLLDEDYKIGDSITIASATDANNNGTFEILEVNSAGLPSVVIENPLGVEQNTVTGTGRLAMFSYVVAAAVDANFAQGENAIFSGHTDANNNGTFEIYKTNQSGNNIWVKNPLGVEQGGAAGSIQTTRFTYNYGVTIDDTQYVVGESAEFSGHSNVANDGKFPIVAVNTSGNDITVINEAGLVQAGAAGTVSTLRWVYSLPTDPTGILSVNDIVRLAGHDDVNNDGDFAVKAINRFGSNDLEIFNPDGVAQAGTNGTIVTAKKIVSFDEDFSADYVANESKVLLEDLSTSGDLTNEFDVVDVNYGVASTNILIDAVGIGTQDGPAGRVSLEARSIFVIKPALTVESENTIRNFQVDESATFVAGVIPAGTILTLDLIDIQEGKATDLVLSLL